jgi:polyhydroxybutyrate depolymerase
MPVSVVTFVGSFDRATLYNEGLDRWRAKQGCKPAAHGYYDTEKKISWTRATCADGSEVVDYQIAGMAHRWPGGTEAGLGSPETKINAVDVMWAFFAAHPLRA